MALPLCTLSLTSSDESTIRQAAERCQELFPPKKSLLHLAICLPGILHPEKSPSELDYDKARLTFETNTLGPLLFMKHFSRFIPSKSQKTTCVHGLDSNVSKHIFFSARVGSISDNRLGGWYSYRASKAALNQLVLTYDLHMRTKSGERAIAFGFHPGTVKTDLSKEFWGNVPEGRLFEPEFVAQRVLKLARGEVDGDVDLRGKCWDWDGKQVPP